MARRKTSNFVYAKIAKTNLNFALNIKIWRFHNNRTYKLFKPKVGGSTPPVPALGI
jgi:hypothetical protein